MKKSNRLMRRSAVIGLAVVVGVALVPWTRVSAAAPADATFNPSLQLAGSDNLGEPSIRTDSTGQSYVIGPAGFPTGGCPAFKVNHTGNSSSYLGIPDHVGGGDCDWALGPKETSATISPAASNELLAFSSLSLANLTVGKSEDGGTTFSPPNIYGQPIAAVDREWMAADPRLNGAGFADIFMTFHDLHLDQIDQVTSTDGGQSYYLGGANAVINPLDVDPLQWASTCPVATCIVGPTSQFSGNELGNIVSRRPTGGALTLYSIFTTPDSATNNENNVNEQNRVYAAVGTVTDLGGTLTPQSITWHDYEIWHGPAGAIYSKIFPSIAVGSDGHVYATWADGTHVYVKTSPNGTDWGCSTQVNHASGSCAGNFTGAQPIIIDTAAAGYPSFNNTAIMPWIVSDTSHSTSAGAADLVWYGATGGAGGNENDTNNKWKVYMAQTIDGFSHWKVFDATPDRYIHTGVICTGGTGCTGSSRILLDFFQVAIDPTTGAADIAFTDDHLNPSTKAFLYFTKQCTGSSAIDVSKTLPAGECITPPGPPPPPPIGTTCPGPQVLDPINDAPNNYPAGDGTNMDNLDIVNAFFNTTEANGNPTTLVVTLTIKNLSSPPPPVNMTSGQWRVLWNYNGHSYFVEADSNGSGNAAVVTYSDGKDGAITHTVTNGQFNTGPNGTIVWNVPMADIDSPPNGAHLTGPTADDRGTFAVQGNGLQYVQPADGAPDGSPTGGADYVIGQVCPTPGNVTPEVPGVPLLLVAGAIGGGLFGLQRLARTRRRRLIA